MKASIRNTVTAAVAAGALVFGGMAVAGANPEPSSPRDTLIEGCTWIDADTENSAPMQRCQVHSEANGRNIPVDIIRSTSEASPHVVQLLDGIKTFDDTNGWARLNGGQIREHAAGVDATFVAPVAPTHSFYMDWQSPRNGETIMMETFMTKELPQFLGASAGVPGGGVGNTGVMGLSAGAFAAVVLAAKSPELYSGVFGLSGFYDLNDSIERRVLDAPWFQEGLDASALWGPYITNRDVWQAHNPMNLISQVQAPVVMSSSTGPANLFTEDREGLGGAILAGGPLEAGSARSTSSIERAAFLNGKRDMEVRWKAVGAHTWDTWRQAAFQDGGFQRFLELSNIPTYAPQV